MSLLAIPYVGPLLTFGKAALQVAARICNAIPGALWACGLLVAAFFWWSAARDRDITKAALSDLQAALANQKIETGKLLANETAAVLRLERELQTALGNQEKTDATNKRKIDALGADLRKHSRVGGGSGLRDPFAERGGSSCTPQSQTVSSAEGGAGNATPTSGLLSAELEGFLLSRFGEADAINAAYISCRADALNLRATWRAWSEGAEPASGPAEGVSE